MQTQSNVDTCNNKPYNFESTLEKFLSRQTSKFYHDKDLSNVD